MENIFRAIVSFQDLPEVDETAKMQRNIGTLQQNEMLIVAVVICLMVALLKYFDTCSKILDVTCSEKLKGKVFVVTGAAYGLGKLTVSELYTREATVIMVCRRGLDGLQVKRTIEDETRKDKEQRAILDHGTTTNVGHLVIIQAALDSFEGVKRAADNILRYATHIDGLYNLALLKPQKSMIVTNDGLDCVLQANVYAPFLLTKLLVPRLRESKGTVVNLTSSFAWWNNASLVGTTLAAPEKYNGWMEYCKSKLASIVMTMKMSKLAEYRGVNYVIGDPGYLRSYWDNEPLKTFWCGEYHHKRLLWSAVRFLVYKLLREDLHAVKSFNGLGYHEMAIEGNGKCFRNYCEKKLPEILNDGVAVDNIWNTILQTMEKRGAFTPMQLNELDSSDDEGSDVFYDSPPPVPQVEKEKRKKTVMGTIRQLLKPNRSNKQLEEILEI